MKEDSDKSSHNEVRRAEDLFSMPDHLSEIENPRLGSKFATVEGVVSSTTLSYMVPAEVTWKYHDEDGDTVEDDDCIPLDDPISIRFVNVSNYRVEQLLKNYFNIPQKASITVARHRVVYKIRLRPPVKHLERDNETGKIQDEEGNVYKSYAVYIVSDEKLPLNPSERLVVQGDKLPDPKTQRATLMTYNVHHPDSVKSFDREKLTDLREKFQSMTVHERVEWILENFERYSGIIDRRNLAYATFLAYFSSTDLEFIGETDQRGWLIVLLIGDTTTGKSETVKKAEKLLQGALL